MQNAANTYNAGGAWLEATVSTANSMMSLATQATNTALSMWSVPLTSGAASAGSPVPQQQTERASSQPSRAEPARSWFSEPSPRARPEPVAAASTERSWYRAPYRSPFDPMFWMSPGHPVDHIQDWIAAMPMAASMMSAAMAAPQMMPRMAHVPHPALPGMALFGIPAPAQWSPVQAWLAPWQSLLGSPAAMSPAPYAGGFPAANVIDFGSAYAAYRTAGGHAAAQIVGSFTGTPEALPEPPPTTVAWPNPFDPFGWFAR
jgi:hypothetical protein